MIECDGNDRIELMKVVYSMTYVKSETVEFKDKFTPEIKKEIVAFANSKGGRIFIGINDLGEVEGVENPYKICEQLSAFLHVAIKPDITMLTSLKIVKIDHMQIIQIDIMRGVDRPYYLTEKGLNPSGVYIRLDNISVQATDTMIKDMIRETYGACYESTRSSNQELNFTYAQAQFKKIGIPFTTMEQTNLCIIGENNLYTNLGLLISDQCPFTMKVSVFDEKDKGVLKAAKEFSGSILKQLVDCLEYLQLNNPVNISYQGITRVETSDYAPLILRENVLNAIIHRDYAMNSSILINIFADRMEFISAGGLANDLSLEDILLGISQPRNEQLCKLFYKLKMIEFCGTGIRKMRSEYMDSGLTPTFSATPNGFKVILPNKNTAQKSTLPSNLSFEKELEDHILKEIHKLGSVTRSYIQNKFQLKPTKCGMIFRHLEERSLIQRHGQGKNTVYLLK